MKSTPNPTMRFLRSHKKTILLIAITATIAVVISSLVFRWLIKCPSLAMLTSGIITMTGVEGYWDENLVNKTTTYDWGTVLPGASNSITLYLRSISNIETRLYRATGNWTFWNSRSEIVAGPFNSTEFMYLTWDYDNSTVRPGESIMVTLTLHARLSSDFIEFLIAEDVKAFSFDIHINASQPS